MYFDLILSFVSIQCGSSFGRLCVNGGGIVWWDTVRHAVLCCIWHEFRTRFHDIVFCSVFYMTCTKLLYVDGRGRRRIKDLIHLVKSCSTELLGSFLILAKNTKLLTRAFLIFLLFAAELFKKTLLRGKPNQSLLDSLIGQKFRRLVCFEALGQSSCKLLAFALCGGGSTLRDGLMLGRLHGIPPTRFAWWVASTGAHNVHHFFALCLF